MQDEEAEEIIAERNRYREALEEVKAFVCGEAVSKWGIDPQTTKSRIRIANTCDVALLNLPKG
jgi:predicted amidohydrolase